MKKVLWISPSVPYDNVPHGGGKTQNFYLKKLKASGGYDIHLLTLARQDEIDKIDLDSYGITYSYKLYEGGTLRNTYRKVRNAGSALLPRHRLGHLIMSYEYGLLKKELEDYAKGLSGRDVPEGKTSPVDIVILEWTGMLLLIPDIKKFFPEAKIVCMEEDVFFQRLGRQYRAEKNLFKKRYFYDIYRTGKNLELSGLSKCDKIVVYSTKDRELLEKGGIEREKIYVTAPYYDNYGIQDEAGKAKEDAKPESESTIKSESEAAHFEHPFIMFYGAMFRPENIDCAKRIIEGIMPALSKTDIELEIVGKTNDDSLKKYENDKIHIRGFVEDVGTYFKNCLCFAAPLSQGAGIKIKTLEALSAGTTVLTNEIGMEGIPASAGRDYYHCRSVNDFTNTIIGLYMGSKKPTGECAARFMEETYNLDRNASEFAVMIEAL